ncbi:unnamed protein product [Ambrosiozyma monospora]|uniref:Unnamed protein product n=1 Tax=Ambrosiozyma monospora TaxID=43982 RepID=A0ACB5TX15_AMBMO|nr:unnamed protein product [Ambrosiozyma monospora]
MSHIFNLAKIQADFARCYVQCAFSFPTWWYYFVHEIDKEGLFTTAAERNLDDYAISQLEIIDSPDAQQIVVGLKFDPDLKLNIEEKTNFFEKELITLLNESSDDLLISLFAEFPQITNNVIFDVSKTADGSSRKSPDDDVLDSVFETFGRVTENFTNFPIKNRHYSPHNQLVFEPFVKFERRPENFNSLSRYPIHYPDGFFSTAAFIQTRDFYNYDTTTFLRRWIIHRPSVHSALQECVSNANPDPRAVDFHVQLTQQTRWAIISPDLIDIMGIYPFNIDFSRLVLGQGDVHYNYQEFQTSSEKELLLSAEKME